MTLPDAHMLSVIALDRSASTPLYKQVYDDLRQAILERRLEPGLRLPSTRDMAEALGVSRNTILNAFDQLIAEGYLEATVGSGTYVTHTLPDDLLRARLQTERVPATERSERQTSAYGDLFRVDGIRRYRGRDHYAFTVGMPALDEFPWETWASLAAEVYRYEPLTLFDVYHEAAGYPPLREAVSSYLKAARAVRCTPEQVLIVSGSQQALFLAAQVLLNPGDRVWMENPGYGGARVAMMAVGAEVVPVPVDADGLDVDAGKSLAANAKAAYVTPSHQFPLGMTLSLERRFKLLDWAERSGTWIIEDDYDSEYRYSGPPLASLQGLDVSDRVIYTGTFSKVMFAGLRLGYLVVPPDLINIFARARELIDAHPPMVNQAVTARFIADGHFTRHIRRMRILYGERRALFMEAIAEEAGDLLTLEPTDCGMHLIGWLPDEVDDTAVYHSAVAHDVDAMALSWFYAGDKARSGLVLGYTGVTEEAIRAGAKRLSAAIRDVVQNQ